MNKFQELVCLVTGSAGGLGRAAVRNLVNQGSKVVICDLPDSKGGELATELGENVVFQPTDITSELDVANAIKCVQSKFGKLNVLLNCAGVGINAKVFGTTALKPLELFEFQKVINTNLIGTFNVIRLACELFSLNKPGESVIINTSSTAAFEGMIGHSAYSASNGGINAMTLPLSRDLANMGVRVVTIAPGLFDTPLLGNKRKTHFFNEITPFPKRLGDPDEYAKLVQFIIENKMINGEVIRLDGALRFDF